jgi:hypothetical protein
MSTMVSTCWMSTGHSSTHAPQVVQRPQHVVVDDRGLAGRVADQRDLDDVAGLGLVDLAEQERALGVHVVAQVLDEHLRAERLAGVPRRALRLAAAALGAGLEVEEAVEGELLDLPDAEDGVLVHRLHVDQLGVSLPSALSGSGRA